MTTEELDALDALANTPELASVGGVLRVLRALPRLLAEARQAAILRAKLDEVTGQRDELARAGKLCLSDGVSMNEAWTAMTKALEAAR